MTYQTTSVDSSNVSSCSYDDKTKILTVTFHDGSTYEYYNVPKSVGNSMPFQMSKGKFIWQSLRGQYSYTKV